MTTPDNSTAPASRTSPSGNTGSRAFAPVPEGAEWMSVNQLRARLGGCAILTIDRRIKGVQDFPKPTYFGRLRFFRIQDVEAYERACAVRTADKAEAKAAAEAAKAAAEAAALET